LIDYPIATDPQAADVLRQLSEDGRSIVGAQFHAWVNPPFDQVITSFNSWLGDLPRGLAPRKITELMRMISRQFNIAPRVFLSGSVWHRPRYAFDPWQSLAIV